ncbi:hypothetical protein ACLSY8_10530 [Avibacterium avium]|uniref:hypothetical protein n=1 Tax=Avibacterium avium TaxID=751 RepID=UPI003BF7CD48
MKLTLIDSNELDVWIVKYYLAGRRSFSMKTEDVIRDATRLEKLIKMMGFTYRVYTEGVDVVTVYGVDRLIDKAKAVGISVHNIENYDPDYEIGKDFINGLVNIRYKKKDSFDFL